MNELSTLQQASQLDLAYLVSLFVFAFSMTITPGPNNLMLTASAINFGFQRTIPHLLGVTFGFTSLCALVAMGLGAVFLQVPILHTVLKIAGSAYLLYLAWKIIQSASPQGNNDNSQPLTFVQAAMFQVINPKGWTMAITGFSAFSLNGDLMLSSAIAVVAAFFIVSIPCCATWALLGTQIRKLLDKPLYLKRFNYTLGGLTAACVVLILM